MALPIISHLIAWLKAHSFPGFFGVPIWDVLVFLKNEIKGGVLVMRSNAIAFSFFISLFPVLLSLFTLFPLLERTLLKYFGTGEDFESLLSKFQENFKDVIPVGVFDTVSDVALNPRFGLFSLGFVLAIYFASNGMLAIMASFEKSYASTFRDRNIFWTRILGIFLTFLVFALVILSVLLVILGETVLPSLLERVGLSNFNIGFLNVLRWITVVAMFYLIITLIYRYGAATVKRFRFFSAGATLATILSLLSSIGFSYYVNYFDTYNKLYGSIGAIIVTMLWIQINAFILLVGFELNASIAVNRDLKQRIKVEHDDF